MYQRAADATQPSPPRWSVRAEFTISHPGVEDAANPPRADARRDGDAVRMTYSWSDEAGRPQWAGRRPDTPQWAGRRPDTPQWAGRPPDAPQWAGRQWGNGGVRSTSSPAAPPSYTDKREPRVIHGDGGRYYGYQKGSLVFTSTPPLRRPFERVQDSGYGSDLLSPNSSHQSGSLPRRAPQPYDGRCRSTCNITLSTNVSTEGEGSQSGARPFADGQSGARSAAGRTHSLRCQTPTVRCERRDSYYGCGDPWCHHVEDLCYGAKISPVPESREDSSTATKRPSRASTFTVGDHQPSDMGSTYTIASDRQSQDSASTVIPERPFSNAFSPTSDKFFRGNVCPVGYVSYRDKRDACVQTAEMIDKCTSPLDSFNNSPKPFQKVRKYGSINRRKTEPISPISRASYSPDSLECAKPTRRLVRSPNLKKIPTEEVVPQKNNDSLKKPRTVHIDVYCTGTELESNDSSSESSENESVKTASTPQTVFESQKVKITHKKAEETEVPRNLQQNTIESKITPSIQEESDDDNASTAYPSKLSSYSTIGDFSASVSSVPRSWTSYSMSSCAIPDEYDSVANTSWKDTYSDLDSLLQSRSSIAPTESLDFVPRKLYSQTQSIDETPEFSSKSLQTPSVASLQPSDSFEYANSEDKLRIMKMEEMLKGKPWQSPRGGRMLLLQQKKMQEYMEKKIKDKKWEGKESDSEDSEGSGKGWTFVKNEEKKQNEDKKLKRDGAFRRPSQEKDKQEETKPEDKRYVDQGSLSDSSPSSSSKSPSAISLRQRLSLDPGLRAPFTILPGVYTEQRSIAKKFGQIVGAMKKPGHHIGPAKNPNCLCDHCQRHFESMGYRNRTRSMGDPPTKYVQNWKEFLENKEVVEEPKQPFTDY